jgi:hypothetical protein
VDLGPHGDPTFATVADDRRLAVRAAVLAGYDALEAAIRAIDDARAGLDRSISNYYGDDDTPDRASY